jgi:hypothetical protein
MGPSTVLGHLGSVAGRSYILGELALLGSSGEVVRRLVLDMDYGFYAKGMSERDGHTIATTSLERP